MTPALFIEPSARDYLIELLERQSVDAVRLFVLDPGTPRAETCLAYCREGRRPPAIWKFAKAA